MNRRQFLAAASSVSLAAHFDKLAWATQTPSYTLLDIQRGSDRFQIDFSTPDGFRTAAWMLRDVRANRVGVPNVEMLQLAAWAAAGRVKIKAMAANRDKRLTFRHLCLEFAPIY